MACDRPLDKLDERPGPHIPTHQMPVSVAAAPDSNTKVCGPACRVPLDEHDSDACFSHVACLCDPATVSDARGCRAHTMAEKACNLWLCTEMHAVLHMMLSA